MSLDLNIISIMAELVILIVAVIIAGWAYFQMRHNITNLSRVLFFILVIVSMLEMVDDLYQTKKQEVEIRILQSQVDLVKQNINININEIRTPGIIKLREELRA